MVLTNDLFRINALNSFFESHKYDHALELIASIEDENIKNSNKMESDEYLQSQIIKSRVYYKKANFQEALAIAKSFRDYLDVKKKPALFFSGLNAIIAPKIFLAMENESLKEIDIGLTTIKTIEETVREKIKYEISEFLSTVAIHYTEFGNYEKAIDYNKECLRFREDIGDKKKISYSYNNLGIAYKHLGNYKDSFRAYEESLRIKKEYGDEYDVASTLMNLGVYYNEYGETNLALDYFDQALQTYLKTNNTLALSNCYLNMANTYKRINKLSHALMLQKKSYDLRITIGNPLVIAIALFEMFHIYILLEQFSEATKILEELQSLANKNDLPKIKQYFTLAKALILKESSSPRDHVKAEALLETVINEALIPYSEVIIATMNKCEILITEIIDNISDEGPIIKELEETLRKSITYVEKESIYPLLAELYWLIAQLAYIKHDKTEMDNYLAKAKIIAEDKKLYYLLTKMSLESNIFYTNDVSMTSYFKESIKIVEQNKIDNQKVDSSDFPSKFLLFTKTGHLLYAFDFQTQEVINSSDNNMVTAFLSAINAFSQKVFAGFIDHIKIENNQIILKFSDPLFFYYVFEGDFFSAVKRLTDIVFEIKADTKLWESLIATAKNSSQVVEDTNLRRILNLVTFPTIKK